MRQVVNLGVSRVLLVGLLAILYTGAATAVTLQEIKERGYARVGVANEIPYGYMDPSGQARGAGPDVARLVLRKLGIKKVDWVVTGFGSLIPGLRAHRFDLVAAEMAILPQRCREVLYSIPDTTYGQGLLVPKGNPKDLHSFKVFAKRADLKVAIMAGADQLEMLQALGVPQSRMVNISSNADAISIVATGRANAYAATGPTVSELASKSNRVEIAKPFKDPVIHGKEQRDWGAFTFANDSKEFRDAFNRAFKTIKGTKRWRKTLSSYGFSKTDIEKSSKKTIQELCSANSTE